MLHGLVSFLARSKYLSIFAFFDFSFMGSQDGKDLYYHYYYYYYYYYYLFTDSEFFHIGV